MSHVDYHAKAGMAQLTLHVDDCMITGERRARAKLMGALVLASDPAVGVVSIEGELSAPGILKYPVPVRALVDARAANAATLRNLLNAEGYESIDQIRAEGLRQGLREGERQAQIRGIMAVLQTRGFTVLDHHSARLQACQDLGQLGRWLIQAVTATSADAALE